MVEERKYILSTRKFAHPTTYNRPGLQRFRPQPGAIANHQEGISGLGHKPVGTIRTRAIDHVVDSVPSRTFELVIDALRNAG